MSDPLAKIRPYFQGATIVWPVIGLTVLLLFNLVYAPSFFRLQLLDGHLYGTLVDIFNQGSKVMLLSIGMTLVIATGGVDLSVGSIMAIAGAAAAMLVTQTSLPFGEAIAIVLFVSLLAGVCNGLLVAYAGIQPIIATLILMVAGRGVAMLLTGGQIITFEHSAFVFLGNGHLLGLPFTMTIVAFILAATLVAARKTAIGLFVETVGDNENAARFCGINSSLLKLLV